MTITYDEEWLTAEDANRLLDKNTHNRPLSQGDILKWATEMEAGNWQFNGEAIKIDINGDLIDGQHRLHAVALQEPGMKIPFLVIRGLQPEAQKTMDQGRKRSAADQLVLAGVNADGTLTAAIRVYLTYTTGILFRDNKYIAANITTPVIVQWGSENSDKVELIRRGIQYGKIRDRRPVVIAMYAIVAEVHDTEKADEFFGRVLDGVGLELGSPILALRNRLDSLNGELARKDRQKISDRDLIASVIVAFNAWVLGKSLGRIQRPQGATWTSTNFPKIASPLTIRYSQAGKKGRSNVG